MQDAAFKRTAKGLEASLKQCPKPCTDCANRKHHWLEDCDPENGDVFMVCKHCDAWRDLTDEDFND